MRLDPEFRPRIKLIFRSRRSRRKSDDDDAKAVQPEVQAKVALEAIRGERTLNQLAAQFHVHPVQIGHRRKAAMEQLADLFVDRRKRKPRDGEVSQEALFEEIGRLRMELDWLKKKLVCSIDDRRPLVEPARAEISVLRQCELLGVNRASLYYRPVGESEENLLLMRLLDEQYTRTTLSGPILLSSRTRVGWSERMPSALRAR